MLLTIKNKEVFNSRKKNNKRLKENPNDKRAKMAKGFIDFKIRERIRTEQCILSKIQKLLNAMLALKNNNDKNCKLQINIIMYKIQELNGFFTLLKCKTVDKIIDEHSVTLDGIYSLEENKRTINNEIFTIKLIPKDKINPLELEESLRDNITTNNVNLFFSNESSAISRKYLFDEFLDKNNIVVEIKTISNTPLFLNKYINEDINKDFRLIAYHFDNWVIDELTDNYEIINLEKIKEELNIQQ